jgi:osmotically-inducible protein OsmY
MRKQWTVLGALVLVLVSMSALACSTRGPHNAVDRAGIEANIRSQIATHYPGKTFEIGIQVTEYGVVTLKGTVDDTDKRTRIVEIAKDTPGVTRVVDEINVHVT